MYSDYAATNVWRGIGCHAGNVIFNDNLIYKLTESAVGDDFDNDIQNGEIGAGITISNEVKRNKIISNRLGETHIIIGSSGASDGDDKCAINIMGNYIKGYGCFIN